MEKMEEVIRNAYKKQFKDSVIDEESAAFYVYKAAWLTATQNAALMLKNVGEQAPNFTIMGWMNQTAIQLLDGEYDEKVKPPKIDGSRGIS